MSVTALATIFQRYFPFMTENKIQRFVTKFRAKIETAKAAEQSQSNKTIAVETPNKNLIPMSSAIRASLLPIWF